MITGVLHCPFRQRSLTDTTPGVSSSMNTVMSYHLVFHPGSIFRYIMNIDKAKPLKIGWVPCAPLRYRSQSDRLDVKTKTSSQKICLPCTRSCVQLDQVGFHLATLDWVRIGCISPLWLLVLVRLILMRLITIRADLVTVGWVWLEMELLQLVLVVVKFCCSC